MIPTARPVRSAAVYCRISLARFGDTIKVDDQERICRELAQHRGWPVSDAHVYKDPNRSAWRHDRKREGWDDMLKAVNAKEIDAIIVFHGDRLIRQPWDLEVLIRLADHQGIRLASPVGERDLDNADDRFILRIEAAQACKESDNTSRRLKRHYDRMAENGLVRLGGRGGRAFGFRPDGLTIVPDDAAMITEVADRILAGVESVGEICRDLNVRGYRTATGGEWSHGSLKKLMLRPRLAGLICHRGQILGPAAWSPILDRETWESVGMVLQRKSKAFGYATNEGKYLLTGIAVCGSCGSPLAIRHNVRSPDLLAYGCLAANCAQKAHRALRYLDPFVEGAVIRLLGDDRIRQQAMGVGGNLGELSARVARLQARRTSVLEQFAADEEMGADVLRITVRRMDAQIAEAQEMLAGAIRPTAVDGLWGVSLDGWRALPLARRRAVVRALLRVIVFPSGRRGPGFDPKSVRLEPTWVPESR